MFFYPSIYNDVLPIARLRVLRGYACGYACAYFTRHRARVAVASSFVTMNKPPVTDTISGAVLHRVPSDPSTIGVL